MNQRPARGLRPAVPALVLLALAVAASSAWAVPAELTFDPGTVRWTAAPGGSVEVALDGAAPAGIPGRLALPLLPVTVICPPGTRLDGIEVTGAVWAPLLLPGPVARFLPPGVEPEADGGVPQAATVRRSGGGYVRGQRLEGLVVAPVQPAPGDGWRVLSRLDLELTFVSDENPEAVRPRRGPRGLPAGALPGRVIEPRPGVSGTPALLDPEGTAVPAEAGADAFDPRFRPSLDGSPVSYVIVTDQAMAPEFQRLADWKTRSGLPAVVRTVEWIRENYPDGVDLPDKIRQFIRDAVTYWGTEWVLLGGDDPVIPVRYGRSTNFGGEEIATDLYYQCLDGNWNANGDTEWGEADANRPGHVDHADILPDVWLGRLPVSTPGQARVVVDKTLTYSIDPPVDAGYPATALLLAEVLFPSSWSPSDTVIYDGAGLAEETSAFLPGSIAVTRLYENSGAFPGSRPESLPTVLSELDRGYGIVHHVGHGYFNNMSVGLGGLSVTIPEADLLDNGNRASVLYAINCTSAAVDFDCIDEHFLTNPGGGAVAAIGATRSLFPGTNHYYDVEFYRLMFQEGYDRLGRASSAAKMAFAPLSQTDNTHRWTQYTLMLLGDPGLKVWTAAPTAFTVDHPSSLAPGGQTVAVTVREGSSPVSGARVTLYKEGEVFASGLTGEDGGARLSAAPVTAGTLRLTVTGGEHLPYLADVAVGAPSGPVAVLVGVDAADDGDGPTNGNGRLEAGESGSITFRVRNSGDAVLSGSSAAAVFPGEIFGIDLAADTEAYSIAPGEEKGFRFPVSVAPGTPELTSATVSLTLEAAGGGKLDGVVRIGAPRLVLAGLTVAEENGNGDGLPQAGETVRITPHAFNRGAGASLPLTASLTALAGATVLDGGVGYGPVDSRGEGPGAGFTPFRVRLDGPAAEARFRLQLNDGGTDRLVRVLDLSPPPPPSGFEASGSATSVTLSWTPVEASDLLRYLVYRSDTEDGPFTRVNGLDRSPVSLYEDSPLPSPSVRFYRVASQDSSGNVSPLGPVVRGTTSIPLMPNFPLDAALGTQSSPVAADVDGDGVIDVLAGREQIYAFHADGSELRDGDGQARTLGIWTWAQLEEGYWATPAVGDLFGDGRLEVVAVSFREGTVFVWDANGEPLPGWPRATEPREPLAISSPVLADLDGDGLPEILVQSGVNLYAFDRFGREVRDGDDDPATDGVFFHTGSAYSYGTPAAADLDGDGRAEIVLPTRGVTGAFPHYGKMYVLDDDGSLMPGWPITFGGSVSSSPAIADLDRNGSLDLIFTTESDSLEVRNVDGSSLAGWPRDLLEDQDILGSPTVADVDHDGSLDVAAVSGNGYAYLFHADGTRFTGFPVIFADVLGNRISARGTPTLANLDADDDLEMVYGNREGWIIARNPDGSFVDGFPVKVDGALDGGPLVMDLDGDGLNELCATGFDRAIFLYHTAGVAGGDPGWPMFGHDPRHTGYVASPITEAAEPRFALAVLQTPEAADRAGIYAVATRSLSAPPTVALDDLPLEIETVDGDRNFYRAWAALSPGSHRVAATGTTRDGVEGTSERTFSVLAAPAPGRWETAAGEAVALWASAPGWPAKLVVERLDPAEARAARGLVPPADGPIFLVGPEGAPAPAGARLRFALPEGWSAATVDRWDGAAWRPVPAAGTGRGTDDRRRGPPGVVPARSRFARRGRRAGGGPPGPGPGPQSLPGRDPGGFRPPRDRPRTGRGLRSPGGEGAHPGRGRAPGRPPPPDLGRPGRRRPGTGSGGVLPPGGRSRGRGHPQGGAARGRRFPMTAIRFRAHGPAAVMAVLALLLAGCGGGGGTKPGGPTAEGLTAEGWTAFESGDFPEAAARFDDALVLDRTYQEARTGRGWARLRSADYAAARADFDTVLTASGTAVDARAGRVVVSAALDQPATARSDAEALLAAAPGFVFSHDPEMASTDVRWILARADLDLADYPAAVEQLDVLAPDHGLNPASAGFLAAALALLESLRATV